MTMLPFGQVAPVSRRAVAYLIDALIASGLGIVLGGILGISASLTGTVEGALAVLLIGAPLVSLALLAWFVVYTIMQSKRGSIGMRAQGLRLANAADGAPVGFGTALVRNIIFWLAASIVVGYFTPLFDGSGRFQGWHDKVAKTFMLDARADAGTDAAAPAYAAPPPAQQFAAPVGQQYAAPTGPPQMPGFGAAPGTQTAAPAAQPGWPANEPVVPPRPPAPASVDETVRAPVPAAPAFAASVAEPVQEDPAPEPAQAEPTPAPAAPGADDGLIAFVPGITGPRPPAPASEPVAAPPAPAAPVSQPAVPSEPATAHPSVDPDDLEETRISIPGHRLVFTWDDGTRISVSRRTLFGRNPAPEEGAVLVPIRDETLSLSKTHFEAASEASGGWITDRHSTNGTTVVRDGHRIACEPGERVRIRLGDAIEIGDRIVTIGGYA